MRGDLYPDSGEPDEEHPNDKSQLLGVVGLTVEVASLVDLDREGREEAVLVDLRDGSKGGVILEHPLFEQLVDEHGKVPERLLHYRVNVKQLPEQEERRNFSDPLGEDPEGASIASIGWLPGRRSASVPATPAGS